jgi:ABC-2 type transport system permease protein
MLRSIFLKTLRDYRKSSIWWTIGILLMVVYIVALFPTIQTSMRGYAEMAEQFPEALKAAFGGEQGWDLFNPAGYLRTYAFSMMIPLLFLILAGGVGSNAIAGEEEKGTLDLLLSNPVPRWQVLVEKFGAMVAYTTALASVTWLSMYLMALTVGMDIGAGNLAAGVFSVTLLALTFGTLALAIGAASGNRGLSTGVAVSLGIAAYVLYTMSAVVKSMRDYRLLSPWYYYAGSDPLKNGLDLGHAAVLFGLIMAFFAAALFVFRRRDISV